MKLIQIGRASSGCERRGPYLTMDANQLRSEGEYRNQASFGSC
jgi:hypothetical protein